MENYERNYVEDVRRAAIDGINAGSSKETIRDVEPFNILQITSPKSDDEVALTLDDVVLVSKQKTLRNGESIPTYEVYDKNARRILSTEDNGMMKFDKEIFEELIRDKIRIIEEQGYNVASMDTLDKSGRIESFFELVNGEITALNKEQAEHKKDEPKRSKIQEVATENRVSVSKRKEMPSNYQEQNKNELNQIKDDLGVDMCKSTKVDDPIFFENNPTLDRNNTYAGLTADGRLFILQNKDGKFEQVKDAFSEPTNETGRTTVIRNDEDNLEDNQKNTYGAIVPNGKNNMRYTAELGQYGEMKLVQQIRAPKTNVSKTRSETDEWISFEVQTGSTNYLDVNREGMENSENITARTRRQTQGYTDGNVYGNTSGKGGLREVSDTMRDTKPADFKYEQMAADDNQRIDAAKGVIENVLQDDSSDDLLYIKNELSRDPDAEKQVDEDLEIWIKEQNGAFTEEEAKKFLTIEQSKIAEQKAQEEQEKSAQNDKEQEKKEDEGRSLEDDALERRLRRGRF